MKYVRILALPVLYLLYIGWIVSLNPQAVGTDKFPLWQLVGLILVAPLAGVIGWLRETRKENARNTTGIVIVTTKEKAPRKFNFLGLLVLIAGAWIFYELVVKDMFGLG